MATSGYLVVATRGYFLMATDTSAPPPRTNSGSEFSDVSPNSPKPSSEVCDYFAVSWSVLHPGQGEANDRGDRKTAQQDRRQE
jgi:hypothetical protein